MRRALRRRPSADGGFTMVEIMVALVILGLIAAALTPLMISAARASVVARRATVAKNLSQQRIDAMRNLTFHIDAQNGPFLDLLDDYYPNISTSSTSLPGGGTGVWVSSGTIPGGTASGPYYQSTFNNAFGVTGFTQVVYAQFLNSAQPLSSPLAASTLTGIAYNSQTVGHDQPPPLLLGGTVGTNWTGVGGTGKSYRTFTEITANGSGDSLITSQSRATALLVKGTAYDGTLLEGGVGIVKADGSLANTSSATSYAQGAYVTDAGVGAASTAYTSVSPPNPAGSTAAQASQGATSVNGGSSCSWGAFGTTQVSDVSSNTAGGLPVAPSDVASGASPAPTVQASLLANGIGSCTGFWFTNQIPGSPSTDPTLQLDPDYPMVNVSDTISNGSLVTSQGSVNATSALGNPGAVSATASVAFATRVQLFRGATFVPTGQTTCGPSGTSPCGSGIVNVFLTSASLACGSGQSPTANYTGYVTYYTQTGWHTVVINWNSSSGSATDPLAGINLSQTVTTYNGNPVPLSAYITSWGTDRSVTPGSNGLSSLSSVVSITTGQTRANDPTSTIGVGVGNLSCVATDNR